jgi:hypothetical protein
MNFEPFSHIRKKMVQKKLHGFTNGTGVHAARARTVLGDLFHIGATGATSPAPILNSTKRRKTPSETSMTHNMSKR